MTITEHEAGRQRIIDEVARQGDKLVSFCGPNTYGDILLLVQCSHCDDFHMTCTELRSGESLSLQFTPTDVRQLLEDLRRALEN